MENSSDTSASSDLGKMKLPELRALAAQRGLRGTSRMRKSELIDALKGAPSGGAKREAAPASEGSKPETPQRSSEPAQKTEPKDTGKKSAPERAGKPDAEPRGGEARRDKPRQQRTSNERPQREGKQQGRPASGEETSKQDARAAIAEELQSRSRGQKDGGRRDGDTVQVLDEIELPEGGGDTANRNRSRRDRGGRRRGRDRQQQQQRRDRQPREGNDNEPLDESSLVPIAGIVDVQSNHAFVRTSGYLPGDNDVYVTLGNVRRWGLRAGDAVVGAVRAAREGERRQQKYNALVRVDSINGLSVEEAAQRRHFAKLTPEYPREQLRLETTPKAITPRMIDLVAPIGKGQRGLIVSPPKAGKTMIIQQIAKAIEINNPEVHLMVVLVDERPEEVTDMRSIVKGEVVASTFDRPASDHTVVAELAIERAKRLVELGQDVVILLDSITRLSRAYNLAAPASGRILSGGVDAAALYPPKKFFGAARNLREGGSLTIVASALVETGSKMDEVIFEEFKGTGNMELRLSRSLADRRIFPAIDINASGTRREEMLFKPEELAIMWKLRRVLGNLDQQAALESVLGKLKETQQNAEFLMLVQRTTASD